MHCRTLLYTDTFNGIVTYKKNILPYKIKMNRSYEVYVVYK